MVQFTTSQLTLGGLHVPGQLVALRHADDLVLWHPGFQHAVDQATNPQRVQPYPVQLSGLCDAGHDCSKLGGVVADPADNGDLSGGLHIPQALRLRFAPLQGDLVAPGAVPQQPLACASDASQHGHAQQVIQPATIGPYGDDVAAADQVIERKRLRGLQPEFGTGPAVGPQAHADFDVQVFGQKVPQDLLPGVLGLLKLVQQVGFTDRRAQIRVCDAPVFRFQVLLGVQHGARKFVDQRQKLAVGFLAVAHVARVVQFLFEHPDRHFIRLGGQVDHKTLGPTGQATHGLAQHRHRVVALAEDPQLVHQDVTGLDACGGF